jgi:glycosyltransferase involved in cell wall biosynthesis
MKKKSQPTIALLHWGNLIEDFLDTIDVSFESFCEEMTGGWLFGYIDALKLVGVKTVLFCISDRVEQPTYHTHIPTGAKICVLPAPKIYHLIRPSLLNPYAWTLTEAVGEDVRGLRRWRLGFYRHILPYLATPLRLLATELKKENCQAILCQEYEYARFDACVLLGKLIGIPVFATFQGGNFQLSRLERYFRPLTIKACGGLIVPTQTEIERVQNKYDVPANKLARIFNPMNVNNWQAIDRDRARKILDLPLKSQIIVWHGRVEIYRKGLDILLDAWEKVCQRNNECNLILLLVGTGSDADKLTQIIQQKNLQNIIWIDKYILDRDLILTYLSAADIYTLPSRHEGFPVAPLEAMACGLPIVATDAPGVPDILEDGESSGGLLVPRANSAALADALCRVLDNEVWRRELSKYARSRLETHFSLEMVGKQLQDLIF